MRTPIRRVATRVATLVASIALAACSSGTTIIVRQPAPPPPPPPRRIEPLEVTLARPIRGHLLVQTNRPSYVALFEIVPDRGVALLAPAYAHQRTWMLAGLNWVPVSWKVQSTMYYGPPSGTAIPARWVYAIASDEPLRLPDEAFHPSYMRRVLGPAAYRGTNPYVTMRAISRAFVPSVVDEAWAEDAYALAATYASDPYRTVRIYCANRTVYEVPEEMADRAWCPVRSPSGGTVVSSAPVRPDSVVVPANGQRIRRRMPEPTPVRTPIDRVREPSRPENAPVATDNSTPRHDTNKDVKDSKDSKDGKDATKQRGNGNAYGHTDDPNVKGRGIENEKRNDPRRTPDPEKTKPEKDTKVKVEQHTPDHAPVQDPRHGPRIDTPVISKPEPEPVKAEAKEEKKEEKQEEKQVRREEKQEEKAEKVEQKAEKPAVTIEPPREPDTPVTAPETKPDKKDEDRSAKPEEKSESKAEVKAETKEEKSEAKAEEKPGGKPEQAPQSKPDWAPGKKDRKIKP